MIALAELGECRSKIAVAPQAMHGRKDELPMVWLVRGQGEFGHRRLWAVRLPGIATGAGEGTANMG